MADTYMLAIDLAKRSFQICATDRAGSVLYNKAVSRAKLEQVLESQAPCIVAMEACATSHFWGRFAQALGHEARLIPPIYVKPFVKRQKNDAADAAAIAEAAVRPNMHYVAVKSPEHQARAVAYRTHQCFVGQRTQMINALRSHLAEFGHVFAQGAAHVKDIRIAIGNEALELPDGVREVARLYLEQIDTLSEKIDFLSSKLREATQRRNATSLHGSWRWSRDGRGDHGLRARFAKLRQWQELSRRGSDWCRDSAPLEAKPGSAA